MKVYQWILGALAAVALIIVGCSKGSSVDTAPLEKNFKSGDPAAQSSADKAVAAIKAGDYAGAMSELKTLAGNAKLTPEQQQAIKDVTAQVEKAIADAAAKAKEQAGKAVQDMQKSLPK